MKSGVFFSVFSVCHMDPPGSEINNNHANVSIVASSTGIHGIQSKTTHKGERKLFITGMMFCVASQAHVKQFSCLHFITWFKVGRDVFN